MSIRTGQLQSGILGYIGHNLGDWGRHEEALDAFRRACRLAELTCQPRDAAYAMTLGGRTLLHLGLHDEALDWLDRALAIATDEKWLTFRPLAELFRLDLDRLRGRDPIELRADLERVFVTSCQLADPCWEGLAAVGLALTYDAPTQAEIAYHWFREAQVRCTRVTDTWVWVEAHALDFESKLALAHGHTEHARAAGLRLLDHSARKQLDSYADGAMELLAQV